ncbi:MAG: 16S rRNA (adenine(1518)-N(6)/adenine(1519)-N(6))-dimethyltransferase RsmA [Bacteriovoracales bacterium]|nr:16S rRNA (adenine(1518)-N(6)/adenine(1519)-N(6))-dimethyltransferase RsmA [Bacteriovoracales bacterium]
MKTPRPKKSWGQHFLQDRFVIDRIINDCPKDSQGILEIGPGAGALTAPLSKLGKPLVALEKDPRFAQVLSSHLGEGQLIPGCALECDYDKLIAASFEKGERIWVVSNLPYQIAGPLTARLFSLPQVSAMTLMVQKEVGEKIHPPEGTKNRASRLWALGQNYFHIKKLASVSPKAFFPAPKVESVVLSFRRRPSPSIPLREFQKFQKFVGLLFAHKRKQILSVLSPLYGRGPTSKILEEGGIPTTLRAEALNLQRVQTLFKSLS